ncbi:hypothetical protein NUW87_11590, partial [Corynebacterium pilbarense]
SRDVTFHEETAFRRARDLVCDTEEQEAPTHDSPSPDEQREEASEIEADPSRDSIEFPMELPPVKRKQAWCREILREAERHSAPKGTFRERKKPDKYSSLIAHLNTVIDSKPSTFVDASKHQVWKDAMNEEYDSILKNEDPVLLIKDTSHTNSIHKIYLTAMEGTDRLKTGDTLVIYRTASDGKS